MASFEGFDAIHVPWVMYGNELNPDVRIEGDIASEVLWRWNHSLHHNVGVKASGKVSDYYRQIGTSVHLLLIKRYLWPLRVRAWWCRCE